MRTRIKKKCKKKRAAKRPILIDGVRQLYIDEVARILNTTIKHDKATKVASLLGMVTTFTDEDQTNHSYNGPSSSGKTHIPVSLAEYMPRDSLHILGHCSPKAFYHDGIYDKSRDLYVLDLERKILIFLDQPHPKLLENLRALLSHDQKNIIAEITDKHKGGLKTKKVLIKGYPSVFFCSAGLSVDEQEATRFFLHAPETTQAKFKSGVRQAFVKGCDREAFEDNIDSDTSRRELKKRIRRIEKAHITSIRLDYDEVIERFNSRVTEYRGSDMRNASKIMSLIKGFTLLNFESRERVGSVIDGNIRDIDEGYQLWDSLNVEQRDGLIPYVHRIYEQVILPAWREKRVRDRRARGLHKSDIIRKHFEVFLSPLTEYALLKQVLPMLESANLLTQETDPLNKNYMLIIVNESKTQRG